MEKLLETRFDAAIELRRSLGLPSVDTTAYRLINSEGDRFGKWLFFHIFYLVFISGIYCEDNYIHFYYMLYLIKCWLTEI